MPPAVVDEGQLLGGDGVVLVDHRDDAVAQQGLERRAQVEIAHPVLEVAAGQEHLAADPAEPLEARLVEAHEPRLAHRRAGLPLHQVRRHAAEAQRLDPQPDGARADDQHLAALAPQPRRRLHHREDPRQGDAAVGVGDHPRAQLEHHAPSRGHGWSGRLAHGGQDSSPTFSPTLYRAGPAFTVLRRADGFASGSRASRW